MMHHVYMATTPDVYELPCFVGSATEVANFCGLTLGSFYCAIARKTQKHNGYHVYKVEIEE